VKIQMQNLFHELETLLSNDSTFMTEGKIHRTVVIERANKLDSSLLKLLLTHPAMKAHFFEQIDDMLVFDKVKFQEFVSNKMFLKDSYTAFKNRIGMSDGNEYLKDNKNVVLNWAYKDCVLEAGMTKEDKGRNEIFYNTTLAPDDISRLFEPKVLTNFSRWDSDAVAANEAKPVTELKESDNLLIKGNNLLALHSLKRRYAGKVKLIYIDPPYNTGSDSFKYNDSFNHCSWLTFMKNRLEVAKELLSKDGAIFVNLDDGEAHYCKVLMDEIFGKENFVANVIWQKKYSPQNDAKWLSDNHDHILCFARNKKTWRPNLLPRTEEMNAKYTNPDNDPRGDWVSGDLLRKDVQKTGVYTIITPSGRECNPPAGTSWRIPKKKYQELLNDNRLWFGSDGEGVPRLKRFLTEVKDGIVSETIWDYKSVGHNQEGKRELIALGYGGLFQTPKPERLLERIIHIGSKENDIVMDFFSGSGTTAAVAHKMGRRWIAIEQMDYIADLPEARLKKVVAGEQGGISKAVNWQGGGEFVYLELMRWNELYIQAIRAAEDTQTLLKTHNEIVKEAYYIHYKADMQPFETEEYQNLTLEEQKKALLDCLEMNHLYVNVKDIEDMVYHVSDDDYQVNKAFYGDLVRWSR
jgi:adenine-specific DNA-methyltransferase